ncbi:MAG TPA: GNAT family N-acetyltransferase [Steroidobacteraceae bacterium]|nr:GNAT family N-acetyltransferase [Steroidobacteraceae bacterium]
MASDDLPGFTLRRATMADLPNLGPLIAASARQLSREDYTPEQVEGALRGAFGTDTQLIRDGSYFVIESEGRLAGCGGWSRRRTLFGSDARAGRDATELDPARDAAKIRAFFIHPDFARRGLGSAMLERCEQDAMAHGFTRFELMGTLPGVRLYAARGYRAGERIDWPLGDGLAIPFIPMSKDAAQSPFRIMRASPEDAGAILELQKLAYESEARLYDDWTLPPLTQTLSGLRDEFATSMVLKAMEGDRIVGSVRARVTDGRCEIGRLVVRPELQGRGVGTMLMRHIEAGFPQVRAFELFTGSRSEANIRLYERLGYCRTREKKVSPAVTLVFLEKLR